LIDITLLTAEERAWIEDDHGKVAAVIGPDLEPGDRPWLEATFRPL
jgi:hypothetical protein